MRMFRDRACVRRRLPLAIIRAPVQHSSIRRPERHVRYRQSSSQSIGDARKGHCLFLAEFDHDSRVLLEPDTAKMPVLRRFVSFARPAEGLVRREAGWARARAAGRRPVALPTSSAPPPCRRRYYQKNTSLPQPSRVTLCSYRASTTSAAPQAITQHDRTFVFSKVWFGFGLERKPRAEGWRRGMTSSQETGHSRGDGA